MGRLTKKKPSRKRNGFLHSLSIDGHTLFFAEWYTHNQSMFRRQLGFFTDADGQAFLVVYSGNSILYKLVIHDTTDVKFHVVGQISPLKKANAMTIRRFLRETLAQYGLGVHASLFPYQKLPY